MYRGEDVLKVRELYEKGLSKTEIRKDIGDRSQDGQTSARRRSLAPLRAQCAAEAGVEA